MTLRRVGAAIVAVFLAAGPLGWAPVASARPAAACPAGDGITVVVDFGHLGGGVQIRCVTTSVSSGLDALSKAGFTYAGAQRFPGLLCRIDGKPADDPCVNAPPSDRYWAYWTATAPGGSWTYSDQGAGNRVPPPGSVEGWAFSEGCDRTPGAGPCPGATTTTTTTTARAPATATTVAPGGGRVAASSTTLGSGAAGSTGGSSTTAAPGEETTATGAGDRAPAAGEEGDAERSALTGDLASAGGQDAPGPTGGSVAGVAVGAAAVLGLVGAGALTARRRRAEGGP